MTNLEKYNKVFKESFEVTDEQLNDNLEYQQIELWDSVGHMGMIACLEEEFNIMFETDDIIDFNSYEKGKELLSKYGILIEE